MSVLASEVGPPIEGLSKWLIVLSFFVLFVLAGRATEAADPVFESACEVLLGTAWSPDVAITRAEVRSVGANQGWPTDARIDYCDVLGVVNIDIRFRLRLPIFEAWNEKMLMYGIGGFAGQFVRYNEDADIIRDGLQLGYADVTTDTGHQGGWSSATFGIDKDTGELDHVAIRNYGHAGVHATAIAAKEIIATFYGQPTVHSYFMGCSGGGMQAMMEVQRYPDDFDGVVAAAPNMGWSTTAARYISIQQFLYPDVDITGKAGDPIVSRRVFQKADRITMEKCDALDGAADGLISDPIRCNIDPYVDFPVCAQGEDDLSCFTGLEQELMAKIYRGPYSGLMPLGPGFAPGHERDWPDWMHSVSWASPNNQYLGANNVLRYFVYADPNYSLTSFSLDQDYLDLQVISTDLDASDANISAFGARGKLLLFHGWADPALPATDSVHYYRRVVGAIQSESSVASFFKAYFVPGMRHCYGGAGPTEVDWLSVLERWVEDGDVPETLIATRSFGAIRERPICPFPEVPMWDGSDPDYGPDSFHCIAVKGEYCRVPGDSDGDGMFGTADMVAAFTAGKYELALNASWEEGDWNQDGRFNMRDLVYVMQDGQYEIPAADSQCRTLPLI